jgi:signal transduction histidine kinase
VSSDAKPQAPRTGDEVNSRLRYLAVAILLGLALPVFLIDLGNQSEDDRVLLAFLSLVTVAVPVGVGIYAWQRNPGNRFGRLLVIVGVLWGLAGLSASDQDLVYSVGRITHWVAELALLYVILAYPGGRLRSTWARRVFGFAVLLLATLYLPTVFLAHQYPLPVPWTSCDGGCAQNAFALTDADPAFVDVLVPVRALLTAATWLAALILLAQWIRGATPAMRRTLDPVLGVGSIRLGTMGAFLAARAIGPDSPAVDALGWALILSVPVVSLGFLIGLFEWRLYAAKTLERLTSGLHAVKGPEELRELLADALDDPRVQVRYVGPSRSRAVNDGGTSVASSEGRSVLAIPGDDPVAWIAYDPALDDHRDLVDAIGACALAALERDRLTDALRESLEEVERSRARIAAAGDAERRRIERDLHDGAQQDLVTLRVKLELAAESLERDPVAAASSVRALGDRVEEILDQVRSLARGIYPPLLADAGLVEALRAVAERSATPTTVTAQNVGRYPPQVESTVYFCCLEALQNAAKHAPGASQVRVDLEDTGSLRFEVRDDGPGLDGSSPHGGMTNMRDRLAAVGGTLEIRSRTNQGTSVIGRIPIDRAVPPAPGWGRRAPASAVVPASLWDYPTRA